MSKAFIQVGIIAAVTVVYGLELFRRHRARTRNRQGLCARCMADLKLQPASTIQNYRTLQPQFYYCGVCVVVLKRRERTFITSIVVVAAMLLVAAYYYSHA